MRFRFTLSIGGDEIPGSTQGHLTTITRKGVRGLTFAGRRHQNTAADSMWREQVSRSGGEFSCGSGTGKSGKTRLRTLGSGRAPARGPVERLATNGTGTVYATPPSTPERSGGSTGARKIKIRLRTKFPAAGISLRDSWTACRNCTGGPRKWNGTLLHCPRRPLPGRGRPQNGLTGLGQGARS